MSWLLSILILSMHGLTMKYKKRSLESSETPVLYIGRMVPKG